MRMKTVEGEIINSGEHTIKEYIKKELNIPNHIIKKIQEPLQWRCKKKSFI